MLAVINNYPAGSIIGSRALERLRRILPADHKIIPYFNVGKRKFADFDGVILTGSSSCLASFSISLTYQPVINLLKEIASPILGICFGLHLIAYAHHSKIERMKNRRKGFYEIDVLNIADPLFDGLSSRITVRENHINRVSTLPESFNLLATSDTCHIEVIKHKRKLMYGVQFHPENFSDIYPDGRSILINFMRIVKC